MTPNPKKHSAKSSTDPLRDQLVAYLDGELSTEDNLRVEQGLSNDDQLRGELRGLEQSWRMLDALPRAPVDSSFTRSTVEMAALATNTAENPSWRRARVTLTRALALAAAASLGFLAIAILRPNPNSELNRDFELLIDLDSYQVAGDARFMRLLWESKLFTSPSDTVAVEPPSSPNDLNPTELRELRGDWERFQELPGEERNRLRGLEQELEHHERPEEARVVLRRYSAWLGTLSIAQRAELSALEPEQRIDYIRARMELLSESDSRALVEWIVKMVESRLESLPQPQRARWRNAKGDHRLALALAMWSKAAGAPRAAVARIDSAEWSELGKALSPSARSKLEAAKTEEKRRKLLRGWIDQASRSMLGKPFWTTSGIQAPTEEELQEFASSDRSTAAEREKLKDLSGPEVQAQLRRWYIQRVVRPRQNSGQLPRGGPRIEGRGAMKAEARERRAENRAAAASDPP